MSKVKRELSQRKSFKQLTGKNLQHLVNEASRIIENPILLCSVDWEIIAYTEGVVTDDPIWNHHIQNRTMTLEMHEFSMDEGISDALTAHGTKTLFHSDKLKYDRIFVKLRDREGILMSIAVIVASDRPFKDGDVALAEEVCKKISVEMEKIDRYRKRGQEIMEYYVRKLIDTDLRNDRYSVDYVQMIYDGLKDYLYAAVADIGQSDPTYAKLEYYRDLLKRTRPAFKYAIYSKYIVIIIGSDNDRFYPRKCFHRLSKLIEQDNIKVGISSRFENLFELSRYYNEAVKALEEGLKTDGSKHFFLYDDKGSSFNR